MTFIHVTYAECLRVLCGNQGGTANFSFVPNQGRSFFCNRKGFLLQKKPTGQDSVPRFIGYAHSALRKYGCQSNRAPARESGLTNSMYKKK